MPGMTPGQNAGASSYYNPQSQWEGAGMTPNIASTTPGQQAGVSPIYQTSPQYQPQTNV